MPIGAFMSGPLADNLGRRSALLISVVPIFLGWSTLALAQSYHVLLIGRFLCGFATGILGGPAQVRCCSLFSHPYSCYSFYLYTKNYYYYYYYLVKLL